jgi:DUF4097 and DUF4098 domain-containing protein YvlB
MKRTLLILLAMTFAALPMAAHGHGRHYGSDVNISIGDDGDVPVTDCSQLRISFDGEPGVRSEETIPAGNLRQLSVNSRRHGGVRITGWDQSGWSIKACKAASTAAGLQDVKVSLSGDELSGTTTEKEVVVYFIIRSPRNATLNVKSYNGPIGLYDVSGNLTLHAENGPVSLQKSTGTIDASTTNGPISFKDATSGTVKLNAENGPIAVHLSGTTFNGSLDANTQNGPIALRVPTGYRSGVVAESRGHGPVSCRAEGCANAKRTWGGDDDDDDGNRRIELGSGPAVIHVSTVNGPLSIK